VGIFFLQKKIHNFNLKFQQIKINYPQIFFKFFSYYLSLKKVFKQIEKLRKIWHTLYLQFSKARAIEKLNECKKKNVKKYPPFKFGPFWKKVYKSSVQSLLLLIKQPLECLLLIKIKKKMSKFQTSQKKTQNKKSTIWKKKDKKNLICDVCENFNIEFSTKASVEKKLCSL